jgi:carbon monoxide dehydrogenase subunit G
MTVTRSSLTVGAPPEAVWALVEDPHHLPRWWPDVARVEDVHPDRWTEVYLTRRGRAVRADFTLRESEAPGPGGDPPGRRVWEQETAGTPFERVLAAAVTELSVEPAGEGTRVTLVRRHKMRGYSWFGGGLLLRRATRRKLAEALEGIARAVG